ncbi:molybdopterin-dependent oxidoreductase [Mycolicibacterium bacteremicum]|uniref:molybdopterin-dependent oxidoreductase n=1 Tax=Mycolicibacterium bacteremicum TaxID=564198 RepID=UPI0026ED6356|nr:molybdopterin-dependent oxidoreductase [Mycolicibacterium bacteremicum]
MNRARARALTAVAVGVLAAAGCSPEIAHTAATVITVEPPQVTAGERIVATGRIVLTVIDGDQRIAFDLAGLERLGVAESRLYEPYVKHDITFEGVPARDIAAYLKLGPTDRIRAVALDGMDLTLGVGDLISSEALLATRIDNVEIPIAEGGPTRLVFPADPLASDLNQWIWSLDTLTVDRA